VKLYENLTHANSKKSQHYKIIIFFIEGEQLEIMIAISLAEDVAKNPPIK